MLPKLCGNRYKDIAQDLLRILDSHHDVYRQMLTSGGGGGGRLRVEGQLAWLVRVCAGLIGGHYVMQTRVEIDGGVMRPTAVVAPNLREGDQLTDADVTRRVLQLILLLQNEGGAARCASPFADLPVPPFASIIRPSWVPFNGIAYTSLTCSLPQLACAASTTMRPPSYDRFVRASLHTILSQARPNPQLKSSRPTTAL